MQRQEKKPIIVLEVQHTLDSSNGEALIEQAKEAFRTGSQQVIVDMHDTDTISTYGFFALHTIISLLNNDPLPSAEQWTTATPRIRSTFRRNRTKNLLIRNPQPHVAQALYSAGFNDCAEIQIVQY